MSKRIYVSLTNTKGFDSVKQKKNFWLVATKRALETKVSNEIQNKAKLSHVTITTYVLEKYNKEITKQLLVIECKHLHQLPNTEKDGENQRV